MAHFGGGLNDGEDREKTKKEVMAEIIAKSKMHKVERQKEKMEDQDLLEKINEDFGLIQSLLLRSENKKYDPTESAENFDKIVNELATEKRSRPTDRMKTQMELVQEQKVRLEELEVFLKKNFFFCF